MWYIHRHGSLAIVSPFCKSSKHITHSPFSSVNTSSTISKQKVVRSQSTSILSTPYDNKVILENMQQKLTLQIYVQGFDLVNMQRKINLFVPYVENRVYNLDKAFIKVISLSKQSNSYKMWLPKSYLPYNWLLVTQTAICGWQLLCRALYFQAGLLHLDEITCIYVKFSKKLVFMAGNNCFWIVSNSAVDMISLQYNEVTQYIILYCSN